MNQELSGTPSIGVLRGSLRSFAPVSLLTVYLSVLSCMPQRLLRPGLKDSQKWNAVDWIAQSLYVRLLMVVDDYGRYYAHPRILLGHCFAMRDDITAQTIASSCQQLSDEKLVIFYDVDGTRYLQLLKWQERVRSASKFPEPNAGICRQLTADCGQMIASPPSPTPPPSPTTLMVTSGYRPTLRECEEVYALYPKKKARKDAIKAITKALMKEGMPKIIEATKLMAEAWRLEPSKQYCPHASTWYNGERYLDPPESYSPNSPFKVNQRNVGIGIDAAKQGRDAAALIAKRNGTSQPELLGGNGL